MDCSCHYKHGDCSAHCRGLYFLPLSVTLNGCVYAGCFKTGQPAAIMAWRNNHAGANKCLLCATALTPSPALLELCDFLSHTLLTCVSSTGWESCEAFHLRGAASRGSWLVNHPPPTSTPPPPCSGSLTQPYTLVAPRLSRDGLE